MPALGPEHASGLAKDVYLLTSINNLQDAIQQLNVRYKMY